MKSPAAGTAIFDTDRIRKDFPILGRQVHGAPLVYLDSAASSQKPVQVLDAMDHYYRHTHANVHRGVHQLSQEATEAFEQARRDVAAFIGAGHPEEVIFTRGTTESINLVAYSFGLSRLQPGDEIIVSGLEHHSNIVPWQLVAGMRQAVIRVIPVLPDGTLDMDAFERLLGPRTRIVAVNHVSNSLGTVNPVEAIIRLAHDRDIPVLIDGAQSIAHMPVDVQALDADFYAFSGHKMLGPTGIGILYGKREWLDALPPWQGGGEMIANVSWSGTTFNELPFKFEAGTPDIAGAIGLAAACRYLSSLDRDAAIRHEDALLSACREATSDIPGLREIGTAPDKVSVFSFVVDGLHPYDIGTLLDQQGIAVRTGHHCTQPLMDALGLPGTVRASFAMYNTMDEVHRFSQALRKAVRILS
jgi:cysteine desulfurase/selenocysteine lyase